MILQLHITYNDPSHSFYRKVLVDDQMTFEHLNELIQIIFQKPHCDPYLFTIQPLNDNEQIYIGHNYQHYFQQSDDCIKKDYDEILKKWLTHENTIIYYQIGIEASIEPITYMITLEKIVTPSNGRQYPLCIGAQGFHSNEITLLTIEQSSEQMIIQLCNELIQQQLDAFGHSYFDWKRSFETAAQLYQLKPWQYLTERDLFIIEEPLSKDLLFCSIIGASGKAFGLVVYPGYCGRLSLESLKKPYTFTHDYLLSITSLNVNYCHENELDEKDITLIQNNELTFSDKNDWIQFRSYDIGYFPWIPDTFGMTILQIAMEQTIEIIKKIQRGWVLPTFHKTNLYFGRKVEFCGTNPSWIETIFDVNQWTYKQEQFTLSLSEFEIAKLKRYPTSTMEIAFDLFFLPEAIQNGQCERPFFPILAIGIHRENGATIYEEKIIAEKNAHTAQSSLYALLRKIEKKPKALYVTEEMERFLKPFTDMMQIQLITNDTLAEITYTKARLYSDNDIYNIKPQL